MIDLGDKRKVYLASPWFTPEQKEVMDKVRNAILSLHRFKVYAPYYDGILVTKNSTYEERKTAFAIDVFNILDSDYVVAIIDDFDPGTIFEMGVVQGYKETIRIYDQYGSKYPAILAYSDVPKRGLNLMLAQSCVGFANGIEELKEKLLNIGDLVSKEEEWRGEVQ